jgi:hypothetical protein
VIRFALTVLAGRTDDLTIVEAVRHHVHLVLAVVGQRTVLALEYLVRVVTFDVSATVGGQALDRAIGDPVAEFNGEVAGFVNGHRTILPDY